MHKIHPTEADKNYFIPNYYFYCKHHGVITGRIIVNKNKR